MSELLIISTISLFLVSLFVIYATVAMVTSPKVIIGTSLTESCPLGQCATNLFNGEKTCSSDPTLPINYNPEYQVCNSQFICDNPTTPYSLNSDGSTNFQGVCQDGIQCRCLKSPQCPEYILSTFNTYGGNPYLSLSGSRTSFVQSSTYTDLSGNQKSSPPIIYENPALTFCTIPVSWINRSSPGCSQFTKMNATNIYGCAQNDWWSHQSGFTGQFNAATDNVCSNGVFAFVPPSGSSSDFTPESMCTIPVGCVRGNSCGSSGVGVYQVPVFDQNLGNTVCKDVDVTNQNVC